MGNFRPSLLPFSLALVILKRLDGKETRQFTQFLEYLPAILIGIFSWFYLFSGDIKLTYNSLPKKDW